MEQQESTFEYKFITTQCKIVLTKTYKIVKSI